jgi:adenylate kinase
MDIVFFGIQGSGKGTQAKKLAAAHGFDIFEAGGELRKIAASGSELGHTVKSYIDEGHLVPLEIIMLVVKEAIMKRPKDQKILFDGIPRDMFQMEEFNKVMNEVGREFHCVHFLLSKEVGMERVLGRGKIEGRVDDANVDVIMKRMNTFFEKTIPVIEEYKKQGKVTEVDASGSVEEIFGKVERVAVVS